MPELPEVETVKEVLKTKILNNKIKNIRVIYPGIIQMDCDSFINQLIGKTLLDIKRRGKYLIFVFDGIYLVSHLRMEGKYFIKNSQDIVSKHEHIIFEFESNESLRYHDTRKFGTMELKQELDLYTTNPLNKLGLEPFSEELTSDYLYNSLIRLRKTIKEALLDQTIITGLGNIYVDEVLFLSKIDPERKANNVSKVECQEIIINSQKVLDKAIKAGGTTIRSYTSSLGVTGLFQTKLLVHTKQGEPCCVCQSIILKKRVGGRGTYFCPKCQK